MESAPLVASESWAFCALYAILAVFRAEIGSEFRR
jgi:hypothetical protein